MALRDLDMEKDTPMAESFGRLLNLLDDLIDLRESMLLWLMLLCGNLSNRMKWAPMIVGK